MTAPAHRQPPGPGHKMGRPSKMTEVIGHREDGTPITTMDRIVDMTRAGVHMDQARAAAGIGRETFIIWLRDGARVMAAQIKAETRGEPRPRLTKTDRLKADFSDRVTRAQSEAVAEAVALSALLARGGAEITHRTVKTKNGQPVEETVRTETLAPDGAMIRFRLAHLDRDHFGTERLEITGPEGAPIELTVVEKRRRVLATLDGLSARLTEPDDADILDVVLVPEPPTE